MAHEFLFKDQNLPAEPYFRILKEFRCHLLTSTFQNSFYFHLLEDKKLLLEKTGGRGIL